MVSMLLLITAGVIVAEPSDNMATKISGFYALYLIATGYGTMTKSKSGIWDYFVSISCLIVCLWGFKLGTEVMLNQRSSVLSYHVFYVFCSLGVVGVLFDAKYYLIKDILLKTRLFRHMLRIVFALLLSTISFFVGQSKHLPNFVVDYSLNFVPLLLVCIAIVYFSIKIRKNKVHRDRIW